jgi:hypothetical protein
MRKIIVLLASVLATSAFALETQSTNQASGVAVSAGSEGRVQVAQACGWYAIYVCSRSRGEAQRWANRNTGRVINTSRARYPNFQPGYYCTVEGPMGRSAALANAARWRRSGASPTAYAKNAC